ncbi:hypothetical protein MYAM1_003957 [Malassezia yamatoensis]|uniref:Major facilitator superfamily (MFS) profile domain-containing protein n=1 Tax=Malassezia yamatoensis TaxID=253288 RepID=A0AAJ5YVL0_9BASI|nr:hypothetical protein MYAM1_003957 [Malassezia yamatoensis]
MSASVDGIEKATNSLSNSPIQSDHHAEHHGVAALVPIEDISEQDKRHVLRKLDWLLLPLASGCVLLQMLDKTLINYANLMNFQTAIGIASQQYSWLGSIFYFGYLAGTPFHALALQKFPLSPYVSIVVVIWGVVLACHAAALNYGAFLCVRFFLGFFEAAINPGFILLTGRFYTRKEQVIRVAVWYSMNGWAMIVGGAITYGILVNPAPALQRWQELFVAVGVVTVAFGILCFFVMPSTPETTSYLNERERGIAVLRVASNKSGIHDTHVKKYQILEAVKDIRLYIFFLAFCTVNISNGGISIFASQIIKAFHFSTPKAALLGMCQGAGEVVAVVIGTIIFVMTNRRDAPCLFGYVIAIVGGVMMTVLDSEKRVARMAGLSLLYFFPVSYPMFYSWMSGAVSGTTKRIVFNATLQVAYCVGNIIGPQVYRSKQEPQYTAAKTVDFVMFAVSAGFVMCLTLVHYMWNVQRDKSSASAHKLDQDQQLEADLSDLTDKERSSYRYPY